MSYLVKAIKKLRPTAEFSFQKDDYSTIKWDVLEGNAPTQVEIDQAIEQVKTEEARAEITKAQAKADLLARLGITEDEARLLLSQHNPSEIVPEIVADSAEATGLKWATPASGAPASDSATVATNQVTNSTSYTDLSTAGPSVTLTTGTKALVIVTSRISVSTSNNYGYHSYAVSGATTIAASDSVAVLSTYPDSNGDARQSSASRLTTLNAGSNTFTSKYRFTGSGSGSYFQAREIIVIDLGSQEKNGNYK